MDTVTEALRQLEEYNAAVQRKRQSMAQLVDQWHQEDCQFGKTVTLQLELLREQQQQRVEQQQKLEEAVVSLKRRTDADEPAAPAPTKRPKLGDLIEVYVERPYQPGRYRPARVTRVLRNRCWLHHTTNRAPFAENPVVLQPCDDDEHSESTTTRWRIASH